MHFPCSAISVVQPFHSSFSMLIVEIFSIVLRYGRDTIRMVALKVSVGFLNTVCNILHPVVLALDF